MDPVERFLKCARDAATQLDFVVGLAEHGESIDGMIGPHWGRGTERVRATLDQWLWDFEAQAATRGSEGVALVVAARKVRSIIADGAEAILAGSASKWHKMRADFDEQLARCGGAATAAHGVAISLSANATSVLQALLESGATSRADALIRRDIEERSGVKEHSLRRALESLRGTSDPCIDSAGSVTGGTWLTSFGVTVAQVVIDEESHRSARNDARTDSKPARKDRASLRDP